jgi:hypothetical protein
MHTGEQRPADLHSFVNQRATAEAGPDVGSRTSASRRLWAGSAWAAICIVLYAFYFRIALSSPINSDEANIALQGWNLVHGHFLLHGWILSDAAFNTLEMPLYGLSELVFGIHEVALDVAAATWFLIVTVLAMLLAMTGSHGRARLARGGLTVAILAMSLPGNTRVDVGSPDHMGTTAFLLACFLLIDRAPGRRWTPPLVFLILFAGELGDVTVRYIAVPAIVVGCGYRMLAARKLRAADGAIALAALASVPLELLFRAAIRHLGAYQMVGADTALVPLREWPQNAKLTFHAIRQLFGAVNQPQDPLGYAGTALGSVCLLLVLAGVIKVLVTWRTASRADQFLVLAIVFNIAALQVTSLAGRVNSAYELSAVLPCGAILAARVVVPAQLRTRILTQIAAGAASLAGLVPLIAVALLPPATGLGNTASAGTLIPWLESHHLSYGLANYWQSSAITVQSGDRVALRTIHITGDRSIMFNWETDTAWFDSSRHDATFVVLENGDPAITTANVRSAFGKPVSIAHVADYEIMIYRKNLLKQVREYPLNSSQ